MDTAADPTTGIWVEIVATVGVGAVELTGAAGSWVGRYGLGKYPHLIPSFGKHSSSALVTCLGSWGFSGHWVVILWVGASPWLWLDLLWLGLGLGPGFETKLPF